MHTTKEIAEDIFLMLWDAGHIAGSDVQWHEPSLYKYSNELITRIEELINERQRPKGSVEVEAPINVNVPEQPGRPGFKLTDPCSSPHASDRVGDDVGPVSGEEVPDTATDQQAKSTEDVA